MSHAISFVVALFWASVMYGQSPSATAPIGTPEQAIAALVGTLRDDNVVRPRFPNWVGKRLDAHSVKAWGASEWELGNMKRAVGELRDAHHTLYCSPDGIAQAQHVWKVRVREASTSMLTFVAYIDSNSKRVIFMMSAAPPYL